MSNSISTASMCLRANQSLSRSSVTAVTAAVPPVSVISVPGRLEQEESNLDRIKVAEQWNTSEANQESTKSDRDKVEEFTLHRAVEKLRVFYRVMQVAAFTFFGGNLVGMLSGILWRSLPAGRVTEGVVSGISAVAWFLTNSTTVVILSSCPIDELDFDIFVSSRPAVCFALGFVSAVPSGTRLFEFPMPRYLGLAASLAMMIHGLLALKCCQRHARRCVERCLPSFCTLMELWFLDLIASSTVNEVALDEPTLITNIWLAVHASLALMLFVWMRCVKTQATLRLYAAAYMSVSWGSSFYGCQALDMALGHKQFEEGRQTDIAIGAAIAFSFVQLIPLLVVCAVGRKWLFKQLATWLDHYRSLQLQDGAFMAMLLDSYVVEVGQPWWLSKDELALATMSFPLQSSSFPVTQLPHSDFVLGHVKEVSDDGRSFMVQLGPEPPAPHAVTAESLLGWRIERQQQALPWPELLKLGRKNLRCCDWAAQAAELWRPDGPDGGLELSRPVRGETIDYFVSHSWSDSPEQKWRALQLVADSFCRHHGRYPTFWVDKFCIDQRALADGLRVLPVNVMSCRKVLCLCGQTFPRRLWCAWELCVLLSFTSLEQALKQLVVVSLSHEALKQLAHFDCSNSGCHDPNEEYRLRRVIDAIGKERFENKIRTLGQLILDRETGGSQGLLVPDAPGINLADSFSTGTAGQSPSISLEPGVRQIERKENQGLDGEEDPMVQISF